MKSQRVPACMDVLRHRSGAPRRIVTAAFIVFLSFIMGATGVLGHSGGGAPTDVPVGYGGRAYGVYVKVPILGGTYFADTGDLPEEGGVLVADFVAVETGVADASVFLSYTAGFGDLAMSETATSDIGLLADTPTPVTAVFGYTLSLAACAGASGATEVVGLRVAGLPVIVTGEPNQVYEIPGVLTLVINEQIDSSSGTTHAITVNALHLWAGGVEVIVSSAYSSVTCDGGGLLPLARTVPAGAGLRSTRGGGIEPLCGSPDCDELYDFVTGGGWFAPPYSTRFGRVNFGFNAGPRPGNPEIKGHLNLVDHGSGDHIQGVNVDFYQVWPNDPEHCRTFGGDADFNGLPGRYQAWVCDYGEPGRNDRFALQVFLDSVTVYYADNYDDSPAPEGGQLDGGNIQLHPFK